MDGKAIHRCLHVLDLEKSIAFYEKALGMTEIRRMGPEDGSWTNVFMGNASDASGFQLELTWNRERTEPYDNGGRDSHLAFTVDDYEAARALHEEMGCICHVNETMGLYFIEDPDGCWLEIRLMAFSGDGVMCVDTEDADMHRLTINGYPAFTTHKNGMSTVVCTLDDWSSVLTVTGQGFSVDDLAQVAEGVQVR